jgi:(2R)-sulfolactate sulfo-lyase subunit beta
VRESDPTLGLAGNPALGRVVDRLVDAGATVIFGETSELTGAEHLIAERCATPEVREAFLRTYRDYVAMIEAKGVGPSRLPAHRGQHPRRPHHH